MASRLTKVVFAFMVLAVLGVSVEGATYTVDDDGPADFSTIQSAIDFAGPNDVVYVFPGTYREGVVMKERVNLFGAGAHVTTIDGQGIRNYVVMYEADSAAIVSGFRITGSRLGGSWSYSGIYCRKGPLIVRNNIIEGNHGGIAVAAAGRPTIINNTIVGNTNGIILGVRGDPFPLTDVGYIYDTDFETAQDYAKILERNRISVELLAVKAVGNTDLGKYRLLLVGSDTGYLSNWGTPEAVTAISKSDKPVVGLGEGGYSLFGKLGLRTGFAHGAHDDTNGRTYVMDRRHIIFNKPNRITIPLGGVLGLYERSGSVNILLEKIPWNISPLGRYPGSDKHYNLTLEDKRYFLWGFTGSQESLTKTGYSLFINVIRYMMPPLVTPEKTHTIMNNIIASNDGLGGIVYYMFGNDGEILYNDVWDNQNHDYFDNHTGRSFSPHPGTGEISADPCFADADFVLGEGSPCIDAGHPSAIYNDPDGTRNDMGVWGGPEAPGRSGFAGSGFIITDIGDVPTAEIIQDKDDDRHGLTDVNGAEALALGIPAYMDCPFGGNLWVHGIFGNANPVTHYQIRVGKWVGSSEPTVEECTPLSDGLTKVKYFIEDANGAVTHKYISLGPDTLDGVDNLYEVTSGEMQKEWVGGKMYWTSWSQADLRMRWNTTSWDDGKYIIRYKAYRYIPMFGLTELTLNPNDLDHVTVVVDNTPVEAEIHSVKYDTGEVIPECGIIDLGDPNENLIFTITASHPSGYLKNYWLAALYGKNKNKGYVVTDHYTGLNEGAPPYWHGVSEEPFNSAAAQPVQLKPWETCAYQFRLRVVARTTNGRSGYIYWKDFYDHYYLDVGGCAWCGGADINRSGRVDWIDYAEFASRWLDSCGPSCE